MAKTLDIIKMNDDEGFPSGVVLTCVNHNRLRISGCRWPLMFWSRHSALKWADVLIRAIEQSDEDGQVPITLFRKMTVNNAKRLVFAVIQIYDGGPTYFTQESRFRLGGTGPMCAFLDCADTPLPVASTP